MDRRDTPPAKWWYALDRKQMKATIIDEDGDEGVAVGVKFEVCGTCLGRGSYVNPDIDRDGISGEEMGDLGDQWQRDYTSGVYDIECRECEGEKVVPVPDCHTPKDVLDMLAERARDDADFAATCAAERRMGA